MYIVSGYNPGKKTGLNFPYLKVFNLKNTLPPNNAKMSAEFFQLGHLLK